MPYYTRSELIGQLELDGWVLAEIPDDLKTPELCMLGVQNASLRLSNSESILHFVPSELREYAICLKAVQIDGSAIRDVPMELRTYELCYQAVKSEGCELDCVPTELRDAPMCAAAVASDGWALLSVPIQLWTPDLLRTAVHSTPDVISQIPGTYITHDLCVIALRHRYATALNIRRYIPAEMDLII